MNFEPIWGALPFILEGALVTLKFTLFSLFLGLPWGILLALLKISPSRLGRAFAGAYTSVFRGTPLLVQLSLIYYGIPKFLGSPVGAFEAGVISFSLNSGAYVSEIFRSGLESIDPGQNEAGRVLGLSRWHIFYHITFPQAIRNVLPALVNEFIDLLKDSAIVSTIGQMDLLYRAKAVSNQTFLYFEPLLIVAAVYYIMVMALSGMGRILRQRLSYLHK